MKKFAITIILLFIFSSANSQNKKIAYCSNQTDNGYIQVFVMNPDGSNKTQVTDLEENCMKPKWSPDGMQIVFYSDRGLIYLIKNIDSVKPKEPTYVGVGYNPSFMSDGSEIMFNNEYEDVLSIFAIDTAKGSEAQLVSNGGYSNMQVLSHSGTKLVFSGFKGGFKCVFIADFNDDSDDYIQKISKNDEANLEPDISSDEKKIVYSSFDNNLKGTIRINIDGDETPLSKGLPSSNIPRFSPDASRIAFVVIDGNDVSLYVMDTDGQGKRNLNAQGGNIGTFEWMDNENIIYDAGTEKNTSIGIINVETGENKIIAEGGFNLHPCSQK